MITKPKKETNNEYNRSTMKFTVATLIALPAIATAFAPAGLVSKPTFTTSLQMAAPAAASKEEDLSKTIDVIMGHIEAENGEPEGEEAASEESEE